jgi:hypothetical protein
VAVDDRYERGLDAYASQFGISREDVAQWFTDRYGEEFGTEAINSAGGAWTTGSACATGASSW